MVLGMIARGLGRSLLKGRKKKVSTAKLMNIGGKEGAQGAVKEKGGALAVRPSMGLVATPKDFAPISTTPGESDVVIIKKQVIQVRDILKDTHSAKLAERVRKRKAKQTEKREVREDKLEKVKPTKPKTGIKMPKMVASIGNFFAWLAFGVILNSLWKFLPKLLEIGKILGPIVKFISGAISKTFGFIVGFIELAYAGYDKLEELIENIGGEGLKEQFHRFSDLFKIMINGALIAAAVGGRAGLLGKALSLLGFGKGAAATAAATTAATTAAGTTAAAGGIGAGAAAGVVAGAGLLASGLGEGIFQLGEKGYNIEEDWKKKADKKWWTDPRKYWWGISAGLMGLTNRLFSAIGGILDVVGAPFRMIIELIRFPFLSKEDQEKQRTNLEKYDARIREQFRKALNMFDFLGLIGDDEGSWGSLYGDAGTDKMGYTKDGKTKSEQDGTANTEGNRGFLGWRSSLDMATLGMWDFDKHNRKGSPKDWGLRRTLGGLADVASFGLTDFDKRGRGNLQFDPMSGGKDKRWGSADEQAKRREKQSGIGIKRGIGGALDFTTLGMFDFDKQNKKGSPKGWGIKRIAGGLADYMTLGLTDFDQRGAGIMQFNSISSGNDKAEGLDTHPSYAQGSMMIIENTTTYIQPIEV